MTDNISLPRRRRETHIGRFDVSHGVITVTACDGRAKRAEIEEDMLFTYGRAPGT